VPDDFQISDPVNRGRTVVLRIQGRLDTKSASQLLKRCTVVSNAGQNLVLNLAEVSFIASSGIGALLALVEQFKETTGTVRFASLSSAVESVIKLLNLDQFLTIDPTEDEAFAALEA
jgi:anti-sigma B factor antagonist